MAEMWILGTIPCRIFNDLHESGFPIPDQVIMGKLDGLGWMLAWMAYLVLVTRK
jgi:hypothetical protein